MKRLVFLVEGDTEVIFINKHVIPYLYQKGYQNPMHPQKIITNRKLHKKGGNVNYEYLKNDLRNTLAQGNVIITTFLDFFRLPTNFPGYTIDSNNIDIIETSIQKDFEENSNIVAYIQKHEIEALMYCNMDGFEIVVDDPKKKEQLKLIIEKYQNPEDINNAPETAPSKRLERIFNYDKIADGEMILEAIGIETIISKCPRFASWIKKLEKKLSE